MTSPAGLAGLVTGAGSGIGRATALRLAAAGAGLWLRSDASSLVTGRLLDDDGEWAAN